MRATRSGVVLAVVLSSLVAASVHAQAAPLPAAPPPSAPGAAPLPASAAPPAGLTAQPAPPPVYAQPVYAAPPYAQQPGTYPVTAYAPAPPPPRRPRLRKGLMIGGIAMLGASYLIGVITGAVLVEISQHTCRSCNEVGNRLFIPFAGPFLAMAHTRADLPLGFLGALQIAGMGLLAGGIVQFVLSKRRAEEEGAYGFDLGRGRKLSLDFQASPARLGPSARLRF